MDRRTRRSLDIVEAEIAAICADAGLACDDLDRLLHEFEVDGDAVRRLSGPIRESLHHLLTLRRRLLGDGRDGRP